MATPQDKTVQLDSLLQSSTAHLLTYSIPLLLLSIPITFAGTFLTLDRTRTFAPKTDVSQSLPGSFDNSKTMITRVEKRLAHLKFRLDGGIGGLAIGYVFGLHASTFLALLIMNESNASPLSSTSFLVVWVLTVSLTTVLGGRWKAAALLFSGMMGGISLSLALSVITHPALFSRVVLASVFTPVVTLVVLATSYIPSQALSDAAHSTARMATSCTGALSITMAVALLTRSQKYQSWANIWDRLWVADGLGWGTSKERGLDAIFCVLWVTGAVCDWSLRHWIGEDPDERWDSYLADYVTSLPNVNDRAGNFRPLSSWWARILEALHLSSSSSSFSGPVVARPFDMIFPSDADLALKPAYLPVPGGDTDDKSPALPAYDEAAFGLTNNPLAPDWELPRPIAGRLMKNKSSPTIGRASPGSTETTMYDLARRPTCLQKAKTAKVQFRRQKLAAESAGRRAHVEFRPRDGFSSSDDSSDDENQLRTPGESPLKGVRVKGSPMVRTHSDATSLSGTTVHPSGSDEISAEATLAVRNVDIDVEKERARLAGLKSTFGNTPIVPRGIMKARAASPVIPGAPEYSDVEEDVTSARILPSSTRDEPGWKPEFLKRAASGASASSYTSHKGKQPERVTPPPGAVHMTPSLVNALGRIAKAQAEAYGNSRERSDGLPVSNSRADHVAISMDRAPQIPGLPFAAEDLPKGEGDEKWAEFWKDVQMKATEVDAR